MHTNSPIVVVSALDGTADIVRALEAGADDYVTKPFQVDELLARLSALQRRARGNTTRSSSTVDPTVIVLDSRTDLVLDLAAGAVRRGGDDVHVTVTELRVLAELAVPPGRVLTRQNLLERVWDRDYFGDERVVDVHIRRLRSALQPSGHDALVQTVRGAGYRFAKD
jgi:DNA-binding response OmpR family regulator